jgi:nucleoid-associated protein EbfC
VAPAPELDINGLIQHVRRLRRQLAARQGELLAAECAGSAGGGLVRATVSGRGELTGLEIAPSAASPERVSELADLVVSAIRDAHGNLRARYAGALNPMADSFGTQE